jgi:hypothetical protein
MNILYQATTGSFFSRWGNSSCSEGYAAWISYSRRANRKCK